MSVAPTPPEPPLLAAEVVEQIVAWLDQETVFHRGLVDEAREHQVPNVKRHALLDSAAEHVNFLANIALFFREPTRTC